MRQLKIEERKTPDSQLVDRYFSDLRSAWRITAKEEVELAHRIKKGDTKALNRLIEANLRFVISVAKQYTYERDLLPDLISQGNLGLIEAAHKYDPTCGTKFISYAVWFIRKEILIYYTSLHKTVRMPVMVETDLRRIKRVESELEMRLQRKPDIDELVRELAATGKAIKEEKIERLLKEEASSIPLDAKENDEDVSPIDWIKTEDPELVKIENQNDGSLLNALLGVLKPAEREVVEKVLGLNDNAPMHFVAIYEGSNKSIGWPRETYKIAIRKMTRKYEQLKKGK